MEDFIISYKEVINQKCEAIQLRLSNGGVESYEDYKELVGELRGLNSAIDLLSDAIKRYDNLGD